ncbi:nitrite/sulfite reductase [Candidatus Nasuia deltocephalinicola]|uniref:nitrite/sulfite reductase n=1 Tax=Candidatus Nasuia deltocephalincola TaxID=1160784 RepID=UPI00216AC645|nr:nitrite/sulfite reductase [Candidatus Nasuia deltocephalinicola]
MYYNNFYYKLIINNSFNNFNKNLINYITGFYNENEFKILRLQLGLYRQNISYMNRTAVHCGNLNFNQLINLSYLSIFYDKKYFHFTTRTNIQFNFIKLLNFFEFLKKLNFSFLHSIQTSGNCVRNITSSNSHMFMVWNWGELIRQWFNLNFEFLFLPRKFKISILNQKKDDVFLKIHDLGFFIKKNSLNKIIFNIIAGGGLGRTPLMGLYILTNLHWKNILNYSDKLIRIYNIYGFRNNIYKSRIKILIKYLGVQSYIKFLNKEFNYSNKFIFVINEKEINFFFFKKFIFKNNKFLKKIIFNFFFLNWLKSSYKNNFIFIPIKNNNKSPGDINIFQIKILYLFFKDFEKLKILNRQNIVFLNYLNIYNIYLKLKKYFFNIFNYNFLTDIISCPGKDYCVLANAKSISISKIIQSTFTDFNSLNKILSIYLNISGCINSCGHHHIGNIGFLGVSKYNNNWYQLFLNNNINKYNSLIFSKNFLSSFIYFKAIFYLIKILKSILVNEKKIFFNDYYYFFKFQKNLNFKIHNK